MKKRDLKLPKINCAQFREGGFSLVELIVVIAIMAVLTVVLAPTLNAYVERTKAQKDDSAMGEVTNAIVLALSEQDIYDEVLRYTCSDNKSCYVDSEGAVDANAVIIKDDGDKTSVITSGDQYMYNNNARLGDEEVYTFAGVMRGMTITFTPTKNTNMSTITLADGVINATESSDYINGAAPNADNMTLSTMSSIDGTTGENYLYNRVRAIIGNTIKLTSQTYRNSIYTVFIRMGTTGGASIEAQDAIKVYGQWNGTNLPANNSTPSVLLGDVDGDGVLTQADVDLVSNFLSGGTLTEAQKKAADVDKDGYITAEDTAKIFILSKGGTI